MELTKFTPTLKAGEIVQNKAGTKFKLKQDSYKVRFQESNKEFMETLDEYVKINGFVVKAEHLTKVEV